MVLRQGLTGEQLQQVLRLATTKQFGPSPLRFQLGQQKSRESILFRLREFRRLAEGPLQKLVHPHPSLYQSSRSPGDRRDRNPTKYGRTSRSNNRTLHERRQQSWLLHDGSVTPRLSLSVGAPAPSAPPWCRSRRAGRSPLSPQRRSSPFPRRRGRPVGRSDPAIASPPDPNP